MACRGFESHSFLFNYIMIFNHSLFVVFSSILIASSLTIILINNAIYTILFTILSFISTACLLLLLECEFMALIFIIIYIGAIAVLFLFVIMMLNIKITDSIKDIVKYFPINNFICTLFLFIVLSVIFLNFIANSYNNSLLYHLYTNWLENVDFLMDIQIIGHLIYTDFILQFLIAGFILLIAIIGSSVLTLNYSNINYKLQYVFKQVSK